MEELNSLLRQVKQYIEDPTIGLPEEIFLFATEITPMVNVDLLIRDNNGRILLAWRNDRYHGIGWHVPGGILRLKESLLDRVQKTALKEIGCYVMCENEPSEIIPIIIKKQTMRSHFITFIYECKLPDDFEIKNENKKEGETGFLAWHSKFPDNMIDVHTFYKKYFDD